MLPAWPGRSADRSRWHWRTQQDDWRHEHFVEEHPGQSWKASPAGATGQISFEDAARKYSECPSKKGGRDRPIPTSSWSSRIRFRRLSCASRHQRHVTPLRPAPDQGDRPPGGAVHLDTKELSASLRQDRSFTKIPAASAPSRHKRFVKFLNKIPMFDYAMTLLILSAAWPGPVPPWPDWQLLVTQQQRYQEARPWEMPIGKNLTGFIRRKENRVGWSPHSGHPSSIERRANDEEVWNTLGPQDVVFGVEWVCTEHLLCWLLSPFFFPNRYSPENCSDLFHPGISPSHFQKPLYARVGEARPARFGPRKFAMSRKRRWWGGVCIVACWPESWRGGLGQPERWHGHVTPPRSSPSRRPEPTAASRATCRTATKLPAPPPPRAGPARIAQVGATRPDGLPLIPSAPSVQQTVHSGPANAGLPIMRSATLRQRCRPAGFRDPWI